MSVNSEKHITVDPEACTGCHACEIACSLKNFHISGSSYSSIRIHEFREENLFVPVICKACEDPACVKMCPMEARKKSESGYLSTNEKKCIKCRTCLYVCPFCAAPVNPANGTPINCDLCKNEELGPWCVRVCKTHKALKFETIEKKVKLKRRKFARNKKKLTFFG